LSSFFLVLTRSTARRQITVLREKAGDLGKFPTVFADTVPPDLISSGSGGSSSLVKCRVGDHVGVNTNRPFNQASEHACHFSKRYTFVPFGILATFPETVGVNFLSAMGQKGEFVEKTLLFAQQGDNLFFHLLEKLTRGISFKA
jgi:hypothetical protein